VSFDTQCSSLHVCPSRRSINYVDNYFCIEMDACGAHQLHRTVRAQNGHLQRDVAENIMATCNGMEQSSKALLQSSSVGDRGCKESPSEVPNLKQKVRSHS
jgi:hypothetical protein